MEKFTATVDDVPQECLRVRLFGPGVQFRLVLSIAVLVLVLDCVLRHAVTALD